MILFIAVMAMLAGVLTMATAESWGGLIVGCLTFVAGLVALAETLMRREDTRREDTRRENARRENARRKNV